MRLFISIPIPNHIKTNLATSAAILKRNSARGSFPRRENYHITLAFLGEVDESRIPLIRSIMDMCKVEAIPIGIEDVGTFHKKDGDVVFRRVESTRRLYNLQDKLTRLLTKNGFNLDKRTFTPHITIGRRVKYEKMLTLSDIVEIMEEDDLFGVSFTADAMHLMVSEQTNGGRKYTSIYQVEF